MHIKAANRIEFLTTMIFAANGAMLENARTSAHTPRKKPREPLLGFYASRNRKEVTGVTQSTAIGRKTRRAGHAQIEVRATGARPGPSKSNAKLQKTGTPQSLNGIGYRRRLTLKYPARHRDS
jgi:hypothetical protein